LRLFAWLIALWLIAPLALVWLPDARPAMGERAASPPFPWGALWASLLVSAAAASLAVALGTAAALLLTLTRLPARPLWGVLLLVPFLAPPTAWSLAHLYCYGPGGVLDRWLGETWRGPLNWMGRGGYVGTVIVLAEIFAPLAMLIVGRGAARLTAVGLESAWLSLSRWKLIGWMLAALRMELLTSLLLALALSLGDLAVPHVLQCPLLTTEVYLRSANYLDPTGALLTASPLVVLAVAAALAVAVLERRRDYASGSISSTSLWNLGLAKWPLVGALALYLIATTGLPLAALVYESRSLGEFVQVVRDARPETENTFLIAGGAMLLAGAASLLCGWRSARGGVLVDAAAMLPLGVPALVLGLAYLRFYNRTWPVELAWIGDGSLLIVLGLAARGWPFATRVWAAGLRRHSPEWREAAELSGLNPWQRFRTIVLPLSADHAAAAGLIAFAVAAGDVEISQLLAAPGSSTLALRLLAMLHFNPHVAASLALLQLLVCLAPVAVYYLVCNRWPQVV
jgi:ABC-type Fe3+ transport system permease subunit